jgi:hypothetical protein
MITAVEMKNKKYDDTLQTNTNNMSILQGYSRNSSCTLISISKFLKQVLQNCTWNNLRALKPSILFTKVPVQSQGSERLCIYVLGGSCLPSFFHLNILELFQQCCIFLFLFLFKLTTTYGIVNQQIRNFTFVDKLLRSVICQDWWWVLVILSRDWSSAFPFLCQFFIVVFLPLHMPQFDKHRYIIIKVPVSW